MGVVTLEARSLKIDNDRLELLRSTSGFDSVGDALSLAIDRSLSKPIQRGKLPGSLRFYFESGVSGYDIDDVQIKEIDSTADGFEDAPDSFQSVFFKAGTGLPFGFNVESGFSYAFSDVKMSSIFANVAFQALDFAKLVYTDVVPSLAFSSGFNFTLSGPSAFSVNLRTLMGGYHRFWMAQVTYIFEISYINLTEVNPSYHSWNLRHGISSLWPLYEGFFLSTALYSELFFGPLEANVTVGYQF